MSFLSSSSHFLGQSRLFVRFEIIYHFLRGTFSDFQTEPGSPVICPLNDILYFFFFFLAFTYMLLYNNNNINDSYCTILYNYLISVSHLECKLCEYKDQVCLNFLLTAILLVPGLVSCTRQVKKNVKLFF